MAHITVSSYGLRADGKTITHVTAHGVKDGEYGDLWSVRYERPGIAGSSAEELGALGRLLLRMSALG